MLLSICYGCSHVIQTTGISLCSAVFVGDLWISQIAAKQNLWQNMAYIHWNMRSLFHSANVIELLKMINE